ncbi:MAG TPA: DUF4157 domain-containing protein [Chitinophaga sp.]|uniref:eCIS core domain-containing protein n=1 Tax=Chitinophaga sp. TaxID=1869181 RepID=UPI002CC422C5|nr:DUF4157 domain-containing protein [Chitinophaga sp.]HVI43437.1 DUF4157 domain-containing protein [Chitinophaga sp.]
MKTNSRRNRRHRNPETAEKKETPFFSPKQKALQTKEDAFFQPKLTIGQAGDTYEREADAVADKVVNKPSAKGNAVQRKEISAVQAMPEKKEEEKKVQKMHNKDKKEEEKKVQKKGKEDKKEEEKKVQKKGKGDKKEEEKPVQKKEDEEVQTKKAGPNKEEEKPVQKKEEHEKKPAADEMLIEDKDKHGQPAVMTKESPSRGTQQQNEHLAEQLREQRNHGTPMSADVNREMSQAIGADFSGVNIHTGDKAKELNNDLGAQAFTHGNDVYFNSGKYDPSSATGKHLLAHELTHVVQQGAASALPEHHAAPAATHTAPGVQREMSTPLPAGVTPNKKTKVASFKAGDFDIVVKPDRKALKGEKINPNGAKTKFNLPYQINPKWTKDGKVESVTITKKLVLETVYAQKVAAKDKSGYGRGAIQSDIKEGHDTLGFHEGSHGTDLIDYVKTHPFPEMVIEAPVSKAEYESLVSEWKTKLNEFVADMQKTTEEKTDNVQDPPGQ